MSKPNTLSARADLTKITNGKDTGIPCITIFGTQKVPERYESGRRKLRLKDTVRKEIDYEGEIIQTDFIVLESPDFKLGKTTVGSLPPHLKKLRMGVIK